MAGNCGGLNGSFQNVLSDKIAATNARFPAFDLQAYTKTSRPFNSILDASTGTTGLLLSALIGSNPVGGSGMMLTSIGNALCRRYIYSPYTTGSDMEKGVSPVIWDVGTDGTRIPYEASKPVYPLITSDYTSRSPELYRQVINQFSVETNPRYAVNKAGRGDTYCNIFLWDVTRAMGAEIPHYVDPETNAPMQYPNVAGAREMTANRIYDWLHENGADYGWYEVGPEQAQMLANQGRPVVTALRNDSGHGHVQVVCPSSDGVYDPQRGVTIAQAGRHLTSYRPITGIYNASLPRVSYFAHV